MISSDFARVTATLNRRGFETKPRLCARSNGMMSLLLLTQLTMITCRS